MELRRGLDVLGIVADDRVEQRLLAYIALLLKWNRVYNLTAIRDLRGILGLHIFDSLSVLPHLPAGKLVDVGSGGGLPGIPLAICDPGRQVVLLESNQKKSSFQTQVKVELALDNVTVVCERAEKFEPAHSANVVISRAFSSIRDFLQVSGHICGPGGHFAAMKGVLPAAEIEKLPPGFHVEQSIPLRVPTVDGERHLILIRPT